MRRKSARLVPIAAVSLISMLLGVATAGPSGALTNPSQTVPGTSNPPFAEPGSLLTLPTSLRPTPVALEGVHATVPPAPRAGTDLTHLSAAEIARYGIPTPPPTSSPQYKSWYRAMKATQQIVAPQLALTTRRTHPAPKARTGSAATSDGQPWAGYVNPEYAGGTWSGPFTFSQAEFTIPSIYSGSGYRYSNMWSGLGVGAQTNNNPNSLEQLLQLGVEIDTYWIGNTNYYSLFPWWEVYPAVQPEVQITNLAIYAHNDVFVSVSQNSNDTVTFWITNVTTGLSSRFDEPYICSPYSRGCTQTESIIEVPSLNNQTPPMTFLGPTNFVNDGDVGGPGQFNWMGYIPYTETTASDPHNNTLAYPSPISGGNFTVYRTWND